jgi:hypothetical protein
MEQLLERIIALEGLHHGERARRQALEARVQALEKRLAEAEEEDGPGEIGWDNGEFYK